MRKGIDEGLALGRTPEFLVQDGLWKLRTGDTRGARTSLEQALSMNPGDIRALQGLKEAFVLQGQGPQVVEKVREYAQKEKNSAAVQEFFGFILWASGDRSAARQAFADAKVADPKYVSADLAQVQLDVIDQKANDAADKLNKILASNPDNLTARLWLGNIEISRGNLNAAVVHFQKAVELNPENTQALNNYAYLLAEHAGKPDEALKYAQKSSGTRSK